MNLYLRLIFLIFRAFKREQITAENLQNEIITRVMPNDLDLNFHMNNGRYMTFCDLTRVDLFVRSGLAKLMLRNKWNPIIAEHTMTYIKPLRVFDKVRVTMDITSSDDKFFYSEHKFYKGEQLVAQGTSKALVISKAGRLSPQFILDEISRQKINTL
jgi:acyl-CoA thioesterase FadM